MSYYKTGCSNSLYNIKKSRLQLLEFLGAESVDRIEKSGTCMATIALRFSWVGRGTEARNRLGAGAAVHMLVSKICQSSQVQVCS
jgi:hypothetical protein